MPRLGSPRSAPSRLSLVASAKTPPHQINGRQCFGGGNVWSCPLDGLDGKPSLANVVLTGRLSILKSLPDDVLKVWVHVGMRAQPVAKEKPRARETGSQPNAGLPSVQSFRGLNCGEENYSPNGSQEKPRRRGASYSQLARIMGFEFERQAKRSLNTVRLHGASVQLPHVR